MRFEKKEYKGFTLIEVIVSVAIFFLVLIAVYSFFMNSSNTMINQSTNVNIDLQAKKLQDSIKQWLLMADQNSIEYLPMSNSVYMEVYEDTSTKKSIKIWRDANQKTLKVQYNLNPNETYNYLDGKVLNFYVVNDTNLISIYFEVDFGNNKSRTYNVLHNKRLY